jgi:protein-L-isoaspartate(D-aspartate) O-methyltransferase
MRRQLIEELRSKGISDERVLAAMNRVPRHLFLDSSFESFAYQDKAFPIGSGQTISQPYTVAFQTEQLALEKEMKILEVGTGSGYQAAVLLEMGCTVYSVERQIDLFKTTKKLLERLQYRPVVSYGDGYKGMPAYAPFDRIIVTAAAKELPQGLLSQLKVGGHMLIPVGPEGEEQRMLQLSRTKQATIVQKDLGAFRFVPMLQDKQH